MSKITVRINGYTCSKIQAIKHTRTFAAKFGAEAESGLKAVMALFDDVDQHGQTTFEIYHYPGAALGRLRAEGVDAEVISGSGIHQIELTGDDLDLLQEALEAFAGVVGLIKSPREHDARALAQRLVEQS